MYWELFSSVLLIFWIPLALWIAVILWKRRAIGGLRNREFWAVISVPLFAVSAITTCNTIQHLPDVHDLHQHWFQRLGTYRVLALQAGYDGAPARCIARIIHADDEGESAEIITDFATASDPATLCAALGIAMPVEVTFDVRTGTYCNARVIELLGSEFPLWNASHCPDRDDKPIQLDIGM